MITIKLGKCLIKTDSVEDRWKRMMQFMDDWSKDLEEEFRL